MKKEEEEEESDEEEEKKEETKPKKEEKPAVLTDNAGEPLDPNSLTALVAGKFGSGAIKHTPAPAKPGVNPFLKDLARPTVYPTKEPKI